MKKSLNVFVAGTVLVLAQMTAHGSVLTPLLTSAGSGDSASYGGTVGFSFSLSSNETLDDLGFYENGQVASADATTQEVALYSASGTELATAAVLIPGTTSDGTFAYGLATPVAGSGFSGILEANTTYVLGTLGTGYIDNSSTGDRPPGVSAGVNLGNSEFSGADGILEFPDSIPNTVTSSSPRTSYVGPTLEFSTPVVPEPSTYAFMGAGLAALAFVYRRSRLS